MALSAIEDRYLSALTEREFPTFTPDQALMASPEGVDEAATPPGGRPGDVLLAMGSSGYKPGVSSERPMSDAFMGLGDMLAGALRGTVAQATGLPGDLEMLARGLRSVFTAPEDQSKLEALARGLEEKTFMPTTERMNQILPPVVPLGAADAASRKQTADVANTLGEFNPLTPAVVGPAIKGAKALGNTLGPTAADMTGDFLQKQGLMPGVVADGPAAVTPVLTRNEEAAVRAAAGRKPALKKTATKAVEDLHSNYPESEGWMPIEVNKIDFKDAKDGSVVAKVEPGKISYDFHTPPEGVPKEAWQSELSARVFADVQSVVDRAAAGDKAALDILAEASWYRTMRDRLRTEFGGIGDVFADVLGTTSAQTDVRQNFKNAVTVLSKFSRGDYDNALAAYEARIASGEPVDANTLTALDKAGEFDLIKSDAGALFNTNSPATMGALLDMFRAIKAGDSPKTPNFTGNLIGLTNEATIDVWAARMLRRLADLPRIPPPAEQGVAGSHLKGSTLFDPKVGSEFGFGQDVFREAADEINKSGIIKNIAPEIGDLGPDDLQAVAWFIEKEKWTNSGWTTKAGEGGSLDYEMSLAGAADQGRISELRKGINKSFPAPARRKGELEMGEQAYEYRVNPLREQDLANKEAMRQELLQSKTSVDRFSLGVSGERPDRPMSNYAQAELAAEFDNVVRDDPSVVTYNLANTYGSFMAKTERALNAEFVARQNFNPLPLERRLVEQGKAYDQDAVFMSKVLKDGASPNARPGVEIYFKQKITPEQMEKVTEMLRKYGVDGFTYVTDMRFSDRINVQAKAGGADTAGLNGLRFQYIPEFDDSFNAANRASIMQQKEDLFRDIVSDILDQGNVSDARMLYYDTKVFFRSDYDEYLARTAGTGNPEARGKQPGSSNAARPNPSGEVGKVIPRSVPNRDSRKTGLVSSQKVNRGRSAPNQGAN